MFVLLCKTNIPPFISRREMNFTRPQGEFHSAQRNFTRANGAHFIAAHAAYRSKTTLYCPSVWMQGIMAAFYAVGSTLGQFIFGRVGRAGRVLPPIAMPCAPPSGYFQENMQSQLSFRLPIFSAGTKRIVPSVK